MMRTVSKVLLLVGLVVMMAGCAAPPPAPPPPTVVVLQIHATADINPNADGRPSPLVLRVYQLRSLAAFEEADFFSLFERDEAVLGQDLARKDEVFLQPGGDQVLTLEPKDDVRAIGVMASFRDIDKAHWKVSSAITPNQTNTLKLDVLALDVMFW